MSTTTKLVILLLLCPLMTRTTEGQSFYCPRNANCTLTGNNTHAGSETFDGRTTIKNPCAIDGMIYVTTGGCYVSIRGAYNALPLCTVSDSFQGSFTGKCGIIYLPARLTTSRPIVVKSILVRLQGATAGTTVINYLGTSGCAIEWDPDTNLGEFFGSGGLFDIDIEGTGAAAGTCGLETTDFSGFQAARVTIHGFRGVRSVGWLDDSRHWYNEKMTVDIFLQNNRTDWEINPASSAAGYPQTTFGYSSFNVKCEVMSGQTCFEMKNGALTNSTVKLSINQVQTDTDGIVLEDHAAFSNNLINVHIEAPNGVGAGHELSIPLANDFANVGEWNQDHPESNLITNLSGYWFPPSSKQFYPTFATGSALSTGPNTVFRMNPCAPSQTDCQVIDVRATPESRYVSTRWPIDSGTLALNTQNIAIRQQQVIADQGKPCTNLELALGPGWGSTAAASGVTGTGQTCEWTITASGTGQAANPTITDKLSNRLPSAATVCSMRMVGGTGAYTMIDQTTRSASAPVFTFNGMPIALHTYKVLRQCGP